MPEGKPEEKYISLSEAAKYSGCYSQEYLSLRARQGKLKAVKFGRNWVTTKQWLQEYLKQVEEFKNNRNNNKVNYVSVKRKIPETTKVEKIEREEKAKQQPTKPIFTQPVSPRAIAVVAALVFVLALVGTLFAYPYFAPELKSVANSIKDGATELVSDVGKFTFDIGEGIVGAGDSVSENIFDFATNVSVGASLIGEEISNKLAQGFIAGISRIFNIPKEFKYYFSRDIKALKNFSKKTILGVSYWIKDFWNNSTYGLRNISENIDQRIKNMRNIGKSVRYKIGRSTGIATETIQTLKKFGRNLGYKMAQSSQIIAERIQELGKIISHLFGKTYQYLAKGYQELGKIISYPFVKAYQYVVKAYQYVVRIGRTILTAFRKVPEKIVGIFKKEAEPELPEEKLLPKPEKEGLIVIPSTEKDEEIKQKIKTSFSDEVRVEPKDKTSGIIIPIFREREGQKYLYLMVPAKE